MKQPTLRHPPYPLLAGGIACVAAIIFFALPGPLASRLSGPVSTRVEVKFDAAHVAHVFASSREDAAFGMGFVHAQRRGGQLQLAKRLSHGRLSELAGPSAIAHDTLVRRLQLVEVARREFKHLPPTEQAILEAYARGVNAALRDAPSDSGHGLLHKIERLEWEGVDCIAWSLFLAFQLSGNWQSELDRLRLSRKLDAAEVRLLIPANHPGGTLDIVQDPAVPQVVGEGAAAYALQDSTGSNSWAVTAEWSRSGSALLANDPHLPLTVPSPWLLARIAVRSEDPRERQDVIGATSPGLPMVLIGRTEQVAWGITRNGADTQDLLVEEIDPAHPSRYRAGAGWAEFSRHTEVIQVRGAASTTITVEASRNGPVIGDLQPSHAESGELVRQRLALRWSALQHHAGSISAALNANRAQDCAQLMEAFRSHGAPAQNVIGADATGRVCFRVAGLIPLRAEGHPSHGLFPASGLDERAVWLRWLNEDELTTVAEGEIKGGFVANANQALAGDASLAGEWDRPHRHQRLLDLLQRRPLHDGHSFRAIQYDTHSYEAIRVLPVLLRTRADGPLANEALALLARFDGNMRAESAAPLIYTAWTDEFIRQVVGRRLGNAEFGALYGRRLFRSALEEILLAGQADKWCVAGSCSRELGESLTRAVGKLASAQGSDLSKWRWGRAHALHTQPLGAATVYGKAPRSGIPLAGDTSTINLTHYEPSGDATYPVRIGANVRLIYDLADRNSSWFVQFGGPDESDSAANRAAASTWQRGRYGELRFEPRRWQSGFLIVPQR